MKSSIYLSIITFLFLFSSCQKEDEHPALPGQMEIEFDNIALIDGIQKQLSLSTPGSNEYVYSNALGQTFNINLLRYYISKIVLEGSGGERYADSVSVTASESRGYYLIDESKRSSQIITLTNIPGGKYNKLSFTVGVDIEGITEGAAGGVLDIATNKMFWNWNSGYISLKFEGQSSASNGGTSGAETIDASNTKGIAYHIGGWKDVPGSAFINNNKRISLNFDTPAQVSQEEGPHVHLLFDVMSLFKGTHVIDFTGNHNVHKPSDGKAMADNIPAGFRFDHIHQ